MKNLKYLNMFAIAIPFLIGMLGFTNESLFIVALISTMLTGIIQVIIGIIYVFLFPNSILIKVYLLLVTFFGISWLALGQNDWVWFLPPSLCIFLTVLLHNQVKK